MSAMRQDDTGDMATHLTGLQQLGRLQPGDPIIDIRGLVKRYGSLTAVDGIELSVAAGEIFGILGPNGAGKTTTLEMIEGLRAPDAGTIQVAGIDAVADPARLRRSIG